MEEKDQQAPWDYKPSGTAVAEKSAPQPKGTSPPPPAPPALTWTASEYVEHERGTGWYIILFLVTAGIAAITYLLTKDYFAIGIIAMLGVLVAFAVRKKPRQVQYQLSNQGIQVGEKAYRYSEFKSFSIIRDGTLSSVELIPLKKIMLPVSAYFGAGDEERIIDIVGQYLPYEQRNISAIDKLGHILRF